MERFVGSGALALMIACGGGTAPSDNVITTPPTLPDPTDTTNTDTGTEPVDLGPFNPDLFELNAWFAFDDKIQRFSNYAIPDQGLAPVAFGITFYDIARQKGCRIVFEIDGRPEVAPWTEKKGAWVALDVPADATVVNGCEGYRFPDVFEDQAEGVLFHVAKWEWGFGVGPLDSAAAKSAENGMTPSQWAATEPFLVGGLFYSDTLAGSDIADAEGYSNTAVSIGFAVDGNFQLDTDSAGNLKPIQRELVNTPNGVATGYYEVSLLLTGTEALANVP